MISTQCSAYADLWAAHRDRAGPLTPADVHGLAADREFIAPSRAHLKRLARVRPATSIAVPRVDVTSAARLAHNEAAAYGLAIDRAMRPGFHASRVARPVPYVRPAPIAPDAPRIAADHAQRRADGIRAECARIASYGCGELGRAWTLFRSI